MEDANSGSVKSRFRCSAIFPESPDGAKSPFFSRFNDFRDPADIRRRDGHSGRKSLQNRERNAFTFASEEENLRNLQKLRNIRPLSEKPNVLFQPIFRNALLQIAPLRSASGQKKDWFLCALSRRHFKQDLHGADRCGMVFDGIEPGGEEDHALIRESQRRAQCRFFCIGEPFFRKSAFIDPVQDDFDPRGRNAFIFDERIPHGPAHRRDPVAGTREDPIENFVFPVRQIGKKPAMLGKEDRRRFSEESACAHGVKVRRILVRMNELNAVFPPEFRQIPHALRVETGTSPQNFDLKSRIAHFLRTDSFRIETEENETPFFPGKPRNEAGSEDLCSADIQRMKQLADRHGCVFHFAYAPFASR